MQPWWERPEWVRLGVEDDEDVVRRRFLELLLVLGGMGWAERSSITARLADEAVTGSRLVEQLDRLALDLAAAWDDGQPARLLARVRGLSAVVSELAERAEPAQRAGLQHLAARVAALAGLLSRFVDDDHAAVNHLIAAETWAYEARDDGVLALAMIWRSDVFSAVQAGRGGPSEPFVREQLERAVRLAWGAPPAVRALALLRQAEEHAVIGATTAAMRFLDMADSVWASALERRDEGLYGIGWSETIHSAFRANVHVLIGRPAAAVPLLGPVIVNSWGSNRIAAVTDYASALARMGEADEAAELLLDALDAARDAGAADRVRRVAGVRQRDLGGHSDVAAVRRLDEALGE